MVKARFGAVAALALVVACGGSSIDDGGSSPEDEASSPEDGDSAPEAGSSSPGDGASTPGSGGSSPQAPGGSSDQPVAPGGETLWSESFSGNVLAVGADRAGELAVVTEDDGVVVRKLRADRTVRWEKRWSAPVVATTTLAVSPAGSVFVGLSSVCTPSCVDMDGAGAHHVLVKLDANGTEEWRRAANFRYGTVTVDPLGNVAYSQAEVIRVLDFRGTERWSATFGDSRRPDDVTLLAFAPDGSLYAGRHESATVLESRLVRLGADGTVRWSREVRGVVTALATSARGTLVARYLDEIAAYEATDGAERFRLTLPAPATAFAVQPGLAEITRVATVLREPGGCGFAVRTFDLAGGFRWERSFRSPGCAIASPTDDAVAVLEGGAVVVGGTLPFPTELGAGVQGAGGFLVGLAP
jgi:outer membrane protein assembly factor BamB